MKEGGASPPTATGYPIARGRDGGTCSPGEDASDVAKA